MTDVAKSSRTICPDCGLRLPQNAPSGLCPACLLKAAMFIADESGSDATAAGLASHLAADSNAGHAVFHGSATVVSPSVDHAEDYPGPGSTLRYFGDYELHEEIARGGMGVVYRARQVRLNRQVALKMIRAGKFSSGTEIQRLRVEAEAAAQLDHPAIVPVFEVGEHEGLHYFTMAFVDGEPLSAKLIAGPIPAQAAAKLMLTVCEAVAYAHEKGVIHRDLKPGNILIDQAGHPRVSDFGLAKQVESDNELTTTGQILGTPSYMPPEQAEGNLNEAGRASDVYSLGAVLYATLTGRPPFQAATTIETLRQVIDQQPVAPRHLNPSIPRDLETICLKCLEKKPALRYSTAADMAKDLKCYLDGHPITARPVSALERSWRWACRRPELSLAFLTLGVVIGVVTVAAYIQQQRHAQAELQVRVEGLVQTIEAADLRQLPEQITDLMSFPDRIVALLELRRKATSLENQQSRLRIDLALAVLSGNLEASTLESWWALSLQELVAIRKIMQPLRAQYLPSLHEILQSKSEGTDIKQKQLRAIGLMLPDRESIPIRATTKGSTLAIFSSTERDPTEQKPNVAPKLWDDLAETLLLVLFENPKEFDSALELFDPAAPELFQALKRRIETSNLTEQQRHTSIALMEELMRDSATAVAELACMVDADTLPLVQRHVDRMGPELLPALKDELNRVDTNSEENGEALSTELQKALATKLISRRAEHVRRRAMAAAWLFRLGQSEMVWPLLKKQHDDSLRHAIVNRIRLTGGEIDPVLQYLKSAIRSPSAATASNSRIDDSELSLLILLVGELAGKIPQPDRRETVDFLGRLFENHPSPGVHSACEWTLNRLQAREMIPDVQQRLASAELSDERNWYVTKSGATMAIIRGPVVFQMGADWKDPDRLANDTVDPVTGTVTRSDEERFMKREIRRDFAIGMKEVSLAEFLQCDPDFHRKINQFMSPTVDYPANKVNWYLAAKYCNWLSEKEGLDASEFCFVPDAEGRYGEGLMLAESYLHRQGYRMPTEAEWECVCRAGTTTPRFFGHCSELMPEYVWYADNSKEQALIIPGTLKPNDLGLFDIFGNVLEWCIDPYAGRPAGSDQIVPDLERGLTADAEAWRIVRGGHLYADEPSVRATELWTFRPLTSDGHYGLRLARTLKSYDGE